MSDYSSTTFRAVQLGLQIRDANDKVSEGFWTRLSNVRSTQEALLTTREGLVAEDTNDPFGRFHSIRRLSALVRVWGVGPRLHRDSFGTYLNPVTGLEFTGFSGNPLSLVPFQGTDSRVPWMFVGDTATLRKAGAAADNEFFQWGIDPPTVAVTAAAFGIGNLNSSVAGAIPYEWRYTYYSSTTGAESNPSPAMAFPIDVVNQQAGLTGAASLDPQVDQLRWYRRGGTLTDANYRLIGISLNTAVPAFDDNFADSAIVLQEILSFEKYRPFQSVDATGTQVQVNLPYLCSFAGKYILGCGDPNRPGYLYWTNPGDPDSANVTNNVQITSQAEALTGVFVYNGQPFCWTRDNLIPIMFGQDIVTFRGQVSACGRGCAAPHAFTADGPQIYFLSQDGIYSTDGQSPAVSLTEGSLRPIFNGLSVGDFTPVDYTQQNDLRLYYAGQELHFIYKDTAGETKHLRWHSAYNRWRQSDYASGLGGAPTCVYEDEGQSSSIVYLGFSSGFLYLIDPNSFTDAGITITSNVRTGSYDFGAPQSLKELGGVIIDADPQGGTITATPFINAEETALTPLVMTGSGRQKFAFKLPDVYAYSFALDYAWSSQGTIYQAEVLHRQDEERIVHWEYPATTFGLSGWIQLRDCYIDLLSTAAVDVTFQVDGTTWGPYSIPSTGNQRLKLYLQTDAIKGKVFRVSLDSTAPFQLYGEDCEFRLKPWNTALGYALLNPMRPSNRETS